METKKFLKAMRPKKYLTRQFLVYKAPSLSQQEASGEVQGFNEGGVVQREGFSNGPPKPKGRPIKFSPDTVRETIELYNNQLVYKDRDIIAKELGFKNTDGMTTYLIKNKIPFPELKKDKAKKIAEHILSNLDESADIYLGSPLKVMGEKFNLPGSYITTSLKNADEPILKEFAPFINKLSNPAFVKKWKGTGLTLSDVMDMHISKVNLPRATTPSQDIMKTAARHYALTGPEKSKIQFFDIKTNKPLTLEQAVDKKSLYTDVYFKIKGNDSKFGIGLSDAPDYVNLDVSGDKLPEFKEMYDVYNQRQDLMNREVINPRTGKKDTFRNVAGDMYKGTFKNSFEMFPYDLDHLDLENNPFSKVRLLPRRINQAAGLMKLHKAPKKYFETIGYNYVKDVDQLFEDEMKLADEVLGPKQRKLYKPYMIAKGVAKKKDLRPDPQFTYTEGQIRALERGEDPFARKNKPKFKVEVDSGFIKTQFEEDPALKRLATAEFGGKCGLANGGRVGFKVGGPGESFDDCIARNFSETLGDAKNIEKNPKQGLSAMNKLNNMMVKGASAGKTALRGLQAVLIGTGVGEIALTAVLEGLGPIEGMAEGEDWRRSLARSPLLGFALSKINPESFSEENLKKIVYGSGLEGEQLKGAEKVVSQFNRLNRIQDLYRQRDSVEDYIQQLIDEGGDPTAIRNSMQGRFAEIDAQLDKEHEEFGKRENLIKRDDVVFLKRGIENYVSEQADKIGSSYLGKTATSGYGAMEDQPYIMEESAFVGDEFYPTKSREQIKAELRKKHAEEILEDRFGYGPMTQIQQDVAGFGKENISLADLFKSDTNAIIGYAEGGVVQRKGFADGPKITRRGFIGAFAALIASLKMGSFGKTGKRITTEAGKKVLKDAPKGTPDWFAPLVDKVFREGVDAGETMKTVTGRETVKKLEVPAPGSEGAVTDKYYVYHNPDTGEIRVDIDAPGIGANGEEFSLYMRPDRVEGIADNGMPMVDEGEFFVVESRAENLPDFSGDPNLELVSNEFNLEDSVSNWHKVEEFATGKTNKEAEAALLKKKNNVESDPVQDVVDRHGEYDYSYARDTDIDE